MRARLALLVLAAAAPIAAQTVPVPGVILDPDGQPVAGASVWLVPRIPDRNRAATQRVVTGDDGRFRFEMSAEDVSRLHASWGFSVWAWKAGRQPIEHHITHFYYPAGQDVRLVLDPAPESVVTVRGPDGSPVPGARVEIRGYSRMTSTMPEGLCEAHRSLTADSDGRVRFADVSFEESFLLFVTAPGFGTQSFTRDWTRKRTSTLDLVATGSVAGRLVDEEGRALAGQRLGLSTRVRAVSPWERRAGSTEVTTDSEGRFQATHLPEGQLRVWVPRKPLEPQRLVLHIGTEQVRAGETTTLQIKASPAEPRPAPKTPSPKLALRGVVVDDRGDPVPGVWVRSSAELPGTGRFSESQLRLAITDAKGAFVLREITSPRPARVRARLGDRMSALVTATPGGEDDDPVRIVLDRVLLTRISGRVVDDRGSGIPGLRVRFWQRGPTDQNPDRAWDRDRAFNGQPYVLTGRDGRFETPFAVRREDDWRVAASRGERVVATSDWFEPPQQGPATMPDIVVRSGRAARGRVISLDGRAIEGASVAFRSGDGSRRTVVTDAQGGFTLPTLDDRWPFVSVTSDAGRGWQLADATDELVIRVGARPSPVRETAPAASFAERRRIALEMLDPILDSVLEEDRFGILTRVLEAHVLWAPRRVAELIKPDVIARDWYRDYARNALAEALWDRDPVAATSLWEGMEDPSWRAGAYIKLAERIAPNDRGRALEMISASLTEASSVDDAAHRVLRIGAVGAELFRFGEKKRARRALDRALEQAIELPSTEWAGYAKACFATDLAVFDLEASLKLTSKITDDFAWDRHHGNIAHRLAAHDPAACERVLGMLKNVESRSRWVSRICHAMVPVDPERARKILRDVGPGPMKRAHAYHVMALAIMDTDRKKARLLLDEAFETLSGDIGGSANAAAAAAAFLPAAAKLAPDRFFEYLGRCVGLRTLPPSDDDPSSKERILGRDALLATLVARWDRDLARRMIPGAVKRLRSRDNWSYRERPAVLLAAAVIDPVATASALAGPIPEGRPGRDVILERIRFAKILSYDHDAVWDHVAEQFLYLWKPGEEDL